MPTSQQVFDIIARDGASGSFRRIAAEADGAGKSIDRLGKAAAGITVVFAAFAVNAAVKFEQSMTRISTQAGVPIQQIKSLSQAVLNLAPKVGTGPDQLAVSLYHVESAFRTTGISAKNALDIVQQAAKLAKIGNANLEDTTQAIIGTLSSRIKGVKDATDAAAQLNQLVGSGDTTLEAVTKAIGTGILPAAQAFGLSFKDIAAGLATLSDNATPIDEAATRFRTTLSLIEKPTKQAQAALQSIGLSTTTLADDFRKPDGLLVAMEDLKSHLDKTFPLSDSHQLSIKEITAATESYKTELLQTGATQKTATDLSNKLADSLKKGGSAATLQAQTILQAFGGAKSGATFLTFFEELDRLQSKYRDWGTSVQAATKFGEAWANQQATAKQKLDDLKASWDVFLVRAGNAILPTLKKITDFLAKHPQLLKDAALGVLAFAGAWSLLKVTNLIADLGKLAGKILGIGTAAATAAPEVAALDAAAGSKGLGSAASGISIFGKAISTAGLLGGGAAVVGIAGIAAGIHEIISDGQVKNLPALDKLATLIGLGGLTGKGATEDVGLALSAAKTGNNRGESQLQYLQRTLGASHAKTDVQAQFPGTALSFQNLIKIIQTGTRGQLQGFLAAYNQLQSALKASPKTIETVDDYLTALFNRYNSARDAAKDAAAATRGHQAEMTKAAKAADLLSTNATKLSKTYGINAGQASNLAKENKTYTEFLSSSNDELTRYIKTLDQSTGAGKSNVAVIRDAVTITKDHANAVLKLTGDQKSASDAFKAGITTIENNAVALGYNKQQLDQVIGSLLGVKANEKIDILVTAKGVFNWADPSQQAAYFNATSPNSPAAAFYATGGLLKGPGTGTSDSIPLWGSAGEFMVNAAATAKWLPFLEHINAKGYAAGGVVGPNALRAVAAGVPPYAGSEVTDLAQHMATTWKGFAAQKLQQFASSVGGGATQWAPLVLQVLGMLGQSASWLPNVLRQINTESGGNPNAINLWDSNAAKGTPSKGILQTIDPTFYAYAGPYASLGPFNAFADTFAALRYTLARYGSLGILGQGHGYALGTRSATRGWHRVGERGPETVWFNGGEAVDPTGRMPGPLVNVEQAHFHNEVDVNSFAQKVALKQRAAMTAVRV